MAGHRARLELDASLGVDAGFASGRIHVLAAREERVANLGAPALEGDVVWLPAQPPADQRALRRAVQEQFDTGQAAAERCVFKRRQALVIFLLRVCDGL